MRLRSTRMGPVTGEWRRLTQRNTQAGRITASGMVKHCHRGQDVAGADGLLFTAFQRLQAMAGEGFEQRLHIFRQHMLAPRQQGPGLRGAHQAQPGAWRESFAKPAAAPGVVEQREHIGQQGFGQMHPAHLPLQVQQIDGAESAGQLRQCAAPLPQAQQRPLGFRVRVTQADAQQESVEL